MTTEWKRDGHTLYFVIEENELVECGAEHPEACMSRGDYATDENYYEQPDPAKCDVAIEELWQNLGYDNMDQSAFAPWKGKPDGAYEVDIEYYYRYWKPTYPDYEADCEFAWRPYGEVRSVVLSHE